MAEALTERYYDLFDVNITKMVFRAKIFDLRPAIETLFFIKVLW